MACRASSTQGSRPTSLYEPVFGLPLVRRKVKYSELLRDIRQGRVVEIAYFDSNVAKMDMDKSEYNVGVEGYCLVIYTDGSVAHVSPSMHAPDVCPSRLAITTVLLPSKQAPGQEATESSGDATLVYFESKPSCHVKPHGLLLHSL